MKFIYTIFLSILVFSAFGQRRYLDASFDVDKSLDVKYAENISVITGAPAQQDLLMDVYTPVGDSDTERPLILVAHTGSFLPPIFNGQATGSTRDSTVVFLCNELAARGYVVAAFSYRLGWNPVGDEDTRRGTLLQAAYRGIQDTRTCVRYFRMSADAMNNPYGIDPDKIGVIGIGTGGYLAMGAATLYDFEEVTLDKFIDTRTNLPYIDESLFGNLFGDNAAQINIPNHMGYSSEIGFSFNLGGALGDNSWVDGSADTREAPMAGVHCPTDIFAPYAEGPVIVPTTNEFVVNVAGTRRAMEYANDRGNNDILANLNAADDPLSDLIDAQKTTDVTVPTMETLKLGTDNFYGFVRPFPEGSPWDWWDKNVLDATVAFINANVPGADFDSDEIHMSGLATNSDMSPQKGRIYMDTVLQLFLPRSCVALGLGCEFTDNEEFVDASTLGFKAAPNPITTEALVSTNSDVHINSVYLYDTSGKLVKAVSNIDYNQYVLKRNSLPSGMYLLKVHTDQGNVIEKLTIK